MKSKTGLKNYYEVQFKKGKMLQKGAGMKEQKAMEE
jgi:hypothetical protein